MPRWVIEGIAMIATAGIVWGDLRRQVSDIRLWVRGHAKQHQMIDEHILSIKVEQSRTEQYMLDNRAALDRIEKKLDRIA